MPTPTTGGAAQDPHGEHGRRGKGNSTGGQEGTTWGEVQPCPGGGLSRQPTAHPHLLTPLLAKGLLSLPEPWWDCRTVLRRASSLLPLQRPRQVGRASQAGRVRGASSRAFPPSPGPARGRGRKAEPGAQPPSSCAPGPSVWGEPHPQHIGRGRGRESGQWGSPGAGDLRISQ